MDSSAWAVVVGAVIGAVISGSIQLILEWRRGSHESRLDRERRQDDRRIERSRFQQQNLLELQECLARFVRAEGAIWHFDSITLRQRGELTQMGDQLSAELFEAQRQLAFRIERLTEDRLRSRLDAFLAAANQTEADRVQRHEQITEADIDGAMLQLMHQHQSLARDMGDVLRTYL